jgi:hypothetical protein
LPPESGGCLKAGDRPKAAGIRPSAFSAEAEYGLERSNRACSGANRTGFVGWAEDLKGMSAMALCRGSALAGILVLLMVGNAAAQVPMTGKLPDFDSAPPAPPPGAASPGGAMMMPPGAPPPGAPAQEPPCFKDFMPLRQDAEKRAGLIRAAAERKASRPEVCRLFKNFAVSEAKVVKFVTANQTQCHIPPEAVVQMKSNHDRTIKTRDNVCAAGAAGGAPGGPPPGPRLSDELGVRGVAGPGNVSPGRGTFDTLTGSALSR